MSWEEEGRGSVPPMPGRILGSGKLSHSVLLSFRLFCSGSFFEKANQIGVPLLVD